MQRFWEKVIYPIIKEYKPKHIVEIGAQHGKNTVKIAQYCKTHNCKISCIDPFPMFDFKSIEKDLGDKFTLYEDLSLNVLGKLSDMDIVLIDGDHNWYTVFNELKLIYKRQKDKFPLVIFHDIGWPYGRRDLYYNVENIAPQYINAHKKAGIIYGQSQLVENDGINAHLDNAIYENDNKNGVLTAIEDFIEETPLDFEFVKFQGLNGLGMLALKEKAITNIIKDKKYILNVLELTEEDRLDKELNIVRLNKKKKSLEAALQTVEDKLKESVETIAIKDDEIESLKSDSIELNNKIDILENSLAEQKEEKKSLEAALQTVEDKLKESVETLNEKEEKLTTVRKNYINAENKIENLQAFQDMYFKYQEENSFYGLRKRLRRMKSYIKLFFQACIYFIKFDFFKAKYFLKLMLNLQKIEQSNLWDEKYYLCNNPDVAMSEVDPVFHYLVYGVNEDRKVSENFEADRYLSLNPDVEESGVNPLFHYIVYGKDEWREYNNKQQQSNQTNEQPNKQNLVVKSTEKDIQENKTIDIILPVYNALDDVKNCINSLYELKTHSFNLIVIDDCSDKETEQYLIEQSKIKNFKLIRNQENLRFTKTVNKGLKESTGDYVVLLNSDTIVTSRWIEKILTCFKSDDKIGIVGPLSNAASWQTVPVRIDKNSGGWLVNEIPDGYSIEEMGLLVETISHKKYPKVPSVNGFCYVIKREVIEKNGFLDEEYFPTGYGEEDDFSIRARNAGFEIAVADDTYIYHAKSKSYTHEVRKVLTHGGRKSLDKKHGKDRIEQLIADWKAETELLKIGKHIESYMQISTKNKKVVYTAIFGNYDSIKDPDYVNDDWDYICYTDNQNLTSNVFTIKYVQPVFEQKTKNARMIKLLSHIFLINYDFSLWIDGSVKIRGRNIDELIEKHKNDYIALHKHIKRDCVYDELKACLGLKKDNSEIMTKQIETYQKEGLPENCGIAETAEILRKQRNENTKKLNTLWWNELNKYSIRDQLSFPYVVWKYGFKYGIMEKNQWLDAYFTMHKHSSNELVPFFRKRPFVSIVLVIESESNINDLFTLINNIIDKTAYENYEIIIAFNKNELDKYIEKKILDLNLKYGKKCKVIQGEQLNILELRNYIAQNHTEKYICFMDINNIIIESTWLDLLISELLLSECTSIVAPIMLDTDYNVMSSGKRIKLKNHMFYEVLNYDVLNGSGNRQAIDYNCFIVSKKSFLTVKMFSNEFSFPISVIDLCFKIINSHHNVKLVSNSQVLHKNIVDYKKLQIESRILQKYYSNNDLIYKKFNKIECNNKIIISIFGTCRVFVPFSLIKDSNLIINNTSIPGYAHTTKEILQQLKNMNNELKIENNLVELVSQNGLSKFQNNNSLLESDIVIIEVSSLRLIEIDGIYLRSNLLRDFLKQYAKIGKFDIFWKDLLHNRLKEDLEISYDIDFNELSSDVQYILKNVKCIEQEKNDFLKDLEKIISYLDKRQKVLLISHFDMYVTGKEIRVPERVKIKEWLQEFADTLNNVFFYNPRYKLEKFGVDRGLLDNSHYSKEFESYISKTYKELLLEIYNN